MINYNNSQSVFQKRSEGSATDEEQKRRSSADCYSSDTMKQILRFTQDDKK